MPFEIVRNDITKMEVDAIVNATDRRFSGSGGMDRAIHQAAGARLRKKCDSIGQCLVGEVKVTRGYDLPCKWIIHTVGPVWNDGGLGERALLASCYRNALRAAKLRFCNSVALPLISTGTFGFPRREALKIAREEITEFLNHSEMTVYLVVYDKDSYQAGSKLYADIRSFIDDHYVQEHQEGAVFRRWRQEMAPGAYDDSEDECCTCIEPDADYSGTMEADYGAAPPPAMAAPCPMPSPSRAPEEKRSAGVGMGLEDFLEQIDESFSQMLLRVIDERGMTDVECYKKANISRKLFSKIRSDVHYRPKKPTVLAFAVALEMNLAETRELLMKAGFALSHSSKFDLIVEYFISKGIYDLYEINDVLFNFDQSILGGGT